MAEARGLHAQVTSDATSFVGGLTRAQAALGGFSGALRAGGVALAAFAGAKGIQAATEEAIKFEQQVAELAKLVGPDIAGPLSESVAELANVLPVARDELFEAAEGAARLGIRGTENITEFTRVMGTIGLVTDVSSEQAATSMARIAKVTETPIEAVGNLGSAINEASNTMAVSFSEVLEASQRAAPGLAQLGAKASDIVTLSAAVAELSANASRSGTRLNRLASTLLKTTAVETYSKALGITVRRFEELRDEDPASLIVDLAEVMEDGGGSARILNDELDETSLRILRTLARNADATRARLDSLNDAFEEGASLQNEFANFAGTAAAQAQLVENRIDDLQRKVGQEFLPVWKDLLSVTLDILAAFNEFADTPLERALPTDAAREMRDLFRDIGAEQRKGATGLVIALEGINRVLPGVGTQLAKLAMASEVADVEMQDLQRRVVALADEMEPGLVDDFLESVRRLFRAVRDGRVDASELQARLGNLASRYIEASGAARQAADAQDDVGEETKQVAQATTEANTAVRGIVEGLREELIALRDGERALLQRKLTQEGASQATIQDALAIFDRIEALQAEIDAEKEAERARERRIEQFRRSREAQREESRRIKERAEQRVESLVSDVRLAKMQEEMRLLNDMADRMAQGFVDAFGRIADGSESVVDAIGKMVTGIIAEMLRLQAQKMFAQFFSSLLGAGILDAPGPITGVESPDLSFMPKEGTLPELDLEAPEFAHGGSFTVPGPGGTDNRLVTIAASPGERVSVGQGGQVPQVNINLSAVDDASIREKMLRTGLLQETVRESVRQAIQAPTKSDSVRSTMLSGQR